MVRIVSSLGSQNRQTRKIGCLPFFFLTGVITFRLSVRPAITTTLRWVQCALHTTAWSIRKSFGPRINPNDVIEINPSIQHQITQTLPRCRVLHQRFTKPHRMRWRTGLYLTAKNLQIFEIYEDSSIA